MTDLLVLDLEAVSSRILGSQVISPIDRALYPGVMGRLAYLRSKGWTIAIVADFPGCDPTEIPCLDIRVGSHFQIQDDGVILIHAAVRVEIGRILKVWTTEGMILMPLGNRVLAQDRTIDQAIEELTHVADLCGAEMIVFCPCLNGTTAIEIAKINRRWRHDWVLSKTDGLVGNFLKPGPGMLEYLRSASIHRFDRCVFIGAQPGDRAAADAADFEYIDFEDWRSGRVTV